MNLEMISRGAAWAYKKYLKSPYTEAYAEAKSEAKDKGLGLWHYSNPESPWEFRKMQREQ
jgi:endonuclease YncB( thermonuclease family)